MAEIFDKPFTQPEPIPTSAISRVRDVLRDGRLHRYGKPVSEVASLEIEFASFSERDYCLAVSSGGAAIGCVLRALGAGPDKPILANAFTLSPVPGAIASTGARTILVDIKPDLLIDFEDLQRKAVQSGARILVLSHMRGLSCDVERLIALCDQLGIAVVEDCAHTLGARWRGTVSGGHGVAACYSTQSYKHMNSGEGGLISCDDPRLMAAAIVLSGSYMHFEQHLAAPASEHFETLCLDMPNCSQRMDEVRAAMLRPQLRSLDKRRQAWRERYQLIEQVLAQSESITLFTRPPEEDYVGSSILFKLPDHGSDGCEAFANRCHDRGVEVGWYGAAEPKGYTSRHESWQFIDPQNCPGATAAVASLFDMRIPLTFTLDDCRTVARIVSECAAISLGTTLGEQRH